MEIFEIREDLKEKVQYLIEDCALSEESLIKSLSYEHFDPEEILIKINECLNFGALPLFNNSNTLSQSIKMLEIFKERIQKGLDEYEDDINFNSFDMENRSEFEFIVKGFYPVMIFGRAFLSIDWFGYGFKDPSEMCYALGAYIVNAIKFKDEREISVLSDNGDELYFYQNNLHGDFRLIKYDLVNKEMLNPLNPSDEFEFLPFSRPKRVSSISGYHSVESSFLNALLIYAYKSKIYLDVVDDIDQFVNELMNEGQSFGFFADAGNYCRSSSVSMLHTIEYNGGNIPNIHTGFDDLRYIPEIEEGELVYNYNGEDKTVFKIPINMVNSLIVGLFKKVLKGNGRSSVSELYDCVKEYKEIISKIEDEKDE